MDVLFGILILLALFVVRFGLPILILMFISSRQRPAIENGNLNVNFRQ